MTNHYKNNPKPQIEIEGLIRFVDMDRLWKLSRETMQIFDTFMAKGKELEGYFKRLAEDPVARGISYDAQTILLQKAVFHNLLNRMSKLQQLYLEALSYIENEMHKEGKKKIG